MNQENFKGRVAGIQWNNRLASNLLMLWFVFAIVVFCILLLTPILLGFAALDHQSLLSLLEEPKIQRRYIIVFCKAIFFVGGSLLYFIYRDFNRIEDMFVCKPLPLAHPDPFYVTLETLCISRGLRMPELYVFTGSAISRMVTAAVLQGTGGRSKVILTQADLNLAQPVQEALAAQIVQRLYTRDALFLTALCFIGFFPDHMAEAANKISRVLLKPALFLTDKIMGPFRSLVLKLRMAKLDVGALELTKVKGPAHDLLNRLAPLKDVQEHYYDSYLPLFITQTDGPYRLRMLDAS